MLGIREGSGIMISVKIVLSHVTESFLRGALLCFKKRRVSKIFMPKWRILQFSIEKMLSHSVEKLRRENVSIYKKCI